jgi:hypothetical protein
MDSCGSWKRWVGIAMGLIMVGSVSAAASPMPIQWGNSSSTSFILGTLFYTWISGFAAHPRKCAGLSIVLLDGQPLKRTPYTREF